MNAHSETSASTIEGVDTRPSVHPDIAYAADGLNEGLWRRTHNAGHAEAGVVPLLIGPLRLACGFGTELWTSGTFALLRPNVNVHRGTTMCVTLGGAWLRAPSGRVLGYSALSGTQLVSRTSACLLRDGRTRMSQSRLMGNAQTAQHHTPRGSSLVCAGAETAARLTRCRCNRASGSG